MGKLPTSGSGQAGPIRIRPRRDCDLAACELLVAATHAGDRYPARLSSCTRTFLAHPGSLGAWAAVSGDELIGHVAVHPDTSAAVMALARDQLQATPGQLAVVARLLVSPSHRGRGAGDRLLGAALAWAQILNRRVILDVDLRLTAAISLYERAGGRRLGTVGIELPDGSALDEAVYAFDPGRCGGPGVSIRRR